ncbi:MAG: type I asparaginase [Flavobacteriales bacterium]|nr:type I asparaginase [Flavobacteriales bacterium]MBP6643330.1 type I asparaginase [Flavobacteriales bacterium]MBP7156923.1 type I asparaginase [Flavobacteriales bacterium]HQV75637.1 type I asparaginase [Flavobacteriales bacterium]
MPPKVLLIYTGGTIGMHADPRTGELRPMDLAHLEDQVPELERMQITLDAISFDKAIDSSDMRPADHVRIAEQVGSHYDKFDGFVVLHGSDTMAYTASALSFLLEGLNKPVILTGSQLPIGAIRTDAKENLITAIQIAAAKDEEGNAMVPEVAVYFEYGLMRGNRTVKVHAERFEAFRSPNWPALAEAGVHIRYDRAAILPHRKGPLNVHTRMDDRLAVVRLYPGIRSAWVRHALEMPDLRAVVLTTFGAGNGPTDPDLIDAFREARDRGVQLLNVTQCVGGRVEQGRYGTSVAFRDMGVVGCADMTVEAAITKAMFLMGRTQDADWVQGMKVPFAGESTASSFS